MPNFVVVLEVITPKGKEEVRFGPFEDRKIAETALANATMSGHYAGGRIEASM